MDFRKISKIRTSEAHCIVSSLCSFLMYSQSQVKSFLFAIDIQIKKSQQTCNQIVGNFFSKTKNFCQPINRATGISKVALTCREKFTFFLQINSFLENFVSRNFLFTRYWFHCNRHKEFFHPNLHLNNTVL